MTHLSGKALVASIALLVASACAARNPADGAMGRARGPAEPVVTKRPCTPELAAIDTRLAGLERTRAATRDRLRAAGFERTAADLIGDATAPPGLAIDAARSADALEQLLQGRSLAYPALANEIDWIALNWFDSALKRWTPRHIRILTSMTAPEFGALKQDTVALRQQVSDIGDLRTRREGLADCAGPASAASAGAHAGAPVHRRAPRRNAP